jgi:hypothetical protein
MIYAEYIEHDRSLPIAIFEHLGRQDGWSAEGDAELANLGRAERIGPEPSVICLWRHAGMKRMDEWEASFRTDEARRDPAFLATRLAIHFVRSGLYDEIVGGPALEAGLHFVEFFAADEESEDDRIRDHFQARAGEHPEGRLDFVLRRVGLLAPDPGCLAVWTFPGYVEVEPIARERHAGSPFRPTAAGLYYDFEDALI